MDWTFIRNHQKLRLFVSHPAFCLWHHVVVLRLWVSLRHTRCFEPVGLSIPTVTLKYAQAWDVYNMIIVDFREKEHNEIKTLHVRSTFWSWDVEKVHGVGARSTFGSQNVQNTPGPDHFWKLRRRKSARCCGAKHMWKSKCTKHTSSGPLLEVEMLKKCTCLWR